MISRELFEKQLLELIARRKVVEGQKGILIEKTDIKATIDAPPIHF